MMNNAGVSDMYPDDGINYEKPEKDPDKEYERMHENYENE